MRNSVAHVSATATIIPSFEIQLRMYMGVNSRSEPLKKCCSCSCKILVQSRIIFWNGRSRPKTRCQMDRTKWISERLTKWSCSCENQENEVQNEVAHNLTIDSLGQTQFVYATLNAQTVEAGQMVRALTNVTGKAPRKQMEAPRMDRMGSEDGRSLGADCKVGCGRKGIYQYIPGSRRTN